MTKMQDWVGAGTTWGVFWTIYTFVMVINLAACPKPIGTPATPPDLSKTEFCVEQDPRPVAGSCGSQVTFKNDSTKPHYSCVVCDTIEVNGCVTVDFQWCTARDYACDDPRCK